MPQQRWSWKLLCTALPPSMVISWPAAPTARPCTEPCTWLIAPLGLMIVLPTSPTTHTLWTVSCRRPSRYIGHLGEIAAVAELERDAHAAALRRLRLPQPDFSATSSTTPRMRPALNRRRAPSAVVTTRGCAEQLEAELHRILARRMRDLVDERLEDEASALLPGARSATGRHAARHHATQSSAKLATKPAGNSFGDDAARRCEPLAFAEDDEVIRATRPACPTRPAALQKWKPAGR